MCEIKNKCSWFDDSELSEKELMEYLANKVVSPSSDPNSSMTIIRLMDIKEFPKIISSMDLQSFGFKGLNKKKPSATKLMSVPQLNEKIDNTSSCSENYQVEVMDREKASKDYNTSSGSVGTRSSSESEEPVRKDSCNSRTTFDSAVCESDQLSNIAQQAYYDCFYDCDLVKDSADESSWYSFRTRYEFSCPSNFCGALNVLPEDAETTTNPFAFINDDRISFSYGYGPDKSKKFISFDKKRINDFKKILQHRRVKAVGPIGLNYDKIFQGYSILQLSVLRKQLDIAKELKLPVILRCHAETSDGYQRIIDDLKQSMPMEYKIHLTSFEGDWRTAKNWLTAFPNLMIGINPLVTKNNPQAKCLKEILKHIPLDRLLLESGSPLIVPEDKKAEFKISFPWFSISVAEMAARLRDIPLGAVLKMTFGNTVRMYNIQNS